MNRLKPLIDFLRGKRETPAKTAKERLQIIISHEHAANKLNNINLPQLKQELLQVIAKYTKIDEDKINIQLEHDNNISVLELSIVLQEQLPLVQIQNTKKIGETL
jgi:cell division topological specificity factor